LLINARAETIAEKPAFRAACRERRCLVPATGFFEWTKDARDAKLPWYIFRADGAPLVMAGVWQDWTGPDGTRLTCCALVTTAANDPMRALHHRMPVVLEPADWPLWLGEAGKGAARLMRAAPDDALAWHRVAPAVNSNRASGAELIAPLAG
jgi:putative SOS response-associated peptidase YedK